MSDGCTHCKNGWFDRKGSGPYFGQDVECVNGVLIDIDVFTEGWERDLDYPVAPCHPKWADQCAGRVFSSDATKRLLDASEQSNDQT